MPRGPSKFRQTDVTRLMRAAEAAGKTAKQLEYDPERGKIVLVIGEPDEIERRPHREKRVGRGFQWRD